MNDKAPHQALLVLLQAMYVEVVMKTFPFVGGFDDKLVPVYTSAKYFVQSRHWSVLTGQSTLCRMEFFTMRNFPLR